MNRQDTITRPDNPKKAQTDKQVRKIADDIQEEIDAKQRRRGRRQWQQERHLLQHMDAKALNDYLLDHE